MKHHARLLLVACVAACTYNEYKNYYEDPITTDPDAGSSTVVGVGGAGVGQGGSGGSDAVAGEGGSAITGSGGTNGDSLDACTGCVRISVPSSRSADYMLELDARTNLSNALVLWRVRVRDYVGDVSVIGYVESGEHNGNSFSEESRTTFAQLNVASGWQDVGIDLAQVEEFRAPAFFDAGGAAGAGFDPGFAFDKSRVRQVGLLVQPISQQGTFTPGTLEVDSVTFSTRAGLNVDFSANQGGFELIDADSATITHVPQ